MIDFQDLRQIVTRRRVTGTVQSPRGKALASGLSSQPIHCLIQPHRGTLKYEVEGVVQDVTEALYCNLFATPGKSSRTDIRVLDTIVLASGQQRRVAFVADEGGQGDHLKVYLIAVNTGTAGTDGDGSVAANSPPASTGRTILNPAAPPGENPWGQ